MKSQSILKTTVKTFCITRSLMYLLAIMLFASCGDNRYSPSEYRQEANDTVTVLEREPNRAPASDTTTYGANIIKDTSAKPSFAKGYAMVYCPHKMITHVPSIINAEITKNDYETAYANFVHKLHSQDPEKSIEAVKGDIKGDSLMLCRRMRVAIEFDSEDFHQVSKNDNGIKSFEGTNTLDWDWIIKPLRSTEKSIVTFKFYCIDSTTNEEAEVLKKTINVAVQVDARSYVSKIGDFLLDDPKTTVTAILIPFISFLGGFFTGRKKK